MSIFEKHCPLCGTTLSLSATACDCGYSFEPSKLEDSAQALGLAAQDEQLYENYLSARLIQVAESLKVAQTLLSAGQPCDPQQVTALSGELAQLQTQLAEQKAKTAKLRKGAATVWEAVNKIRTARAVQAQMEQKKQEARALHAKQVSQAKALAAKADQDIRSAKAKRQPAPAPIQAKPPAPASAVANATPPPAPPKPQASEAARQKVRQARQAAAQARAAAHALKATQAVTQKGPSQQATEAFRAAQAAKAAKALAAAQTKQKNICPHCTADLPMDARRCRCGYELVSDNDQAGLTLDDADREAMAAFSNTGPAHITKLD